jgi:hypothetical protein
LDITFTCKCGQEIVIDEAGAGITVDCPGCGKPVYVPTKEPAKTKDTPIRVETPLAKLMAKQGQTPTPVANPSRPPNPFLPAHKREDVHPSIQASLICLLVSFAIGFVAFIVSDQEPFVAVAVAVSGAPFEAATLVCAIYGLCIGQIKHGLMLLSVMAFILGLSYWVTLGRNQRAALQSLQQMQHQMEQRLQQFQNQLPKSPR